MNFPINCKARLCDTYGYWRWTAPSGGYQIVPWCAANIFSATLIFIQHRRWDHSQAILFFRRDKCRSIHRSYRWKNMSWKCYRVSAFYRIEKMRKIGHTAMNSIRSNIMCGAMIFAALTGKPPEEPVNWWWIIMRMKNHSRCFASSTRAAPWKCRSIISVCSIIRSTARLPSQYCIKERRPCRTNHLFR